MKEIQKQIIIICKIQDISIHHLWKYKLCWFFDSVINLYAKPAVLE